MRTSVAAMNGKYRLKDAPSGRLGEIHQMFLEVSGRVVEIPARKTGEYRKFYGAIKKLNLFYDCDIRRVGKRKYALVGMWTDKGYVDFVAKNWRRQSA